MEGFRLEVFCGFRVIGRRDLFVLCYRRKVVVVCLFSCS